MSSQLFCRTAITQLYKNNCTLDTTSAVILRQGQTETACV